MAVMNFGEKMTSVYLTRFAPSEGVPTRVSLLSMSVVGLETHWVDQSPYHSYRGSYKCTGGTCCRLFGARSQSYNVPVWVYNNPQAGVSGEMHVWAMSSAVYRELTALASRYDIFNQYDLDVTRIKQGQGYRTSINICPDNSLRSLWSASQKQTIERDVANFIATAETTLCGTLTEQQWTEVGSSLGVSSGSHSAPLSVGQPVAGNQLLPPNPNQSQAPNQFPAPNQFSGQPLPHNDIPSHSLGGDDVSEVTLDSLLA